MEIGTTTVEPGRILPLLKRYLYSDREIFLRELIANGVDAIQKIRVVAQRGSVGDEALGELRIDIRVERSQNVLSVCDTGVGMTYDEVKEYINRVAVSGTSDFLERHSQSEPLIGFFGVGFYSVFSVAYRVQIETKSYLQSEHGCKWESEDGVEFSLDSCVRTTRGTQVSLHLGPDSQEFLNPERIKSIVRKYCDFVPYPIYLNGSVINSVSAFWYGPRTGVPASVYRDFYRRTFPASNDCRFWVHVNSDYPAVIRGVLYIPHSPNEKGGLRLFCNRVFVDEHFNEAVPQFLGFVRGVLDVEDLPLNLSRDRIQQHALTQKLRSLITRKVAEAFAEVAQTRREDYLLLWTEYERPLKIGAMEEDTWMKTLWPWLLFPSSRGGYTTLMEYAQRNSTTSKLIIPYISDALTQRAYLEEYRRRNKEVVHFTGDIDLLLLERIRSLAPEFGEFRRIDTGVAVPFDTRDQATEDEARQNAFLEMFRGFSPWPSVKLSHVKDIDYPVFLRRIQNAPEKADIEDLLRRLGKHASSQSVDDWQLTLNTAHPLVQALMKIHSENRCDPLLAKIFELLCQHTAAKFGLATDEDISTFLSQTEDVLTWICQQYVNALAGPNA